MAVSTSHIAGSNKYSMEEGEKYNYEYWKKLFQSYKNI